MNIRFAENGDLAAIARLNDRLRAGGNEHRLPLDPSLPGEEQYRPEGFPVYRRWMVLEDGQEIRSALQLCHHNVFLFGEKRVFCWADFPICEGIVDRRYSLTIIQLLKGAMKYQPFLMGLGAGSSGADSLMMKLGWRREYVPFFFYPVKATRALLGLTYLKRPKLRYGAIAGAWSGLGLGLSGILALRRRLAASPDCEAIEELAFGEWADTVFTNSLADYSVAVRCDSTTLNILYPPDDSRLVRMRVRRRGNGDDLGWVIVANKRMSNSDHFGNLNVGTLVDGFGKAADVPILVSAAIRRLVELDCDIIVTNVSHAAWVRACRHLGMIPGPSNFQFFAAPGASPILEPSCPLRDIHLTRGLQSNALWALV